MSARSVAIDHSDTPEGVSSRRLDLEVAIITGFYSMK